MSDASCARLQSNGGMALRGVGLVAEVGHIGLQLCQRLRSFISTQVAKKKVEERQSIYMARNKKYSKSFL